MTYLLMYPSSLSIWEGPLNIWETTLGTEDADDLEVIFSREMVIGTWFRLYLLLLAMLFSLLVWLYRLKYLLGMEEQYELVECSLDDEDDSDLVEAFFLWIICLVWDSPLCESSEGFTYLWEVSIPEMLFLFDLSSRAFK